MPYRIVRTNSSGLQLKKPVTLQPGFDGANLVRQLTAQLVLRYGFFRMPPMPPDPRQVEQRALAVRQVIAYVRRNPAARIGLAPEGRDLPGGVLGWPPPGGGRFMLTLAQMGLALSPAGVYEEGGRLVVRVGPSFALSAPAGLRGEELDCHASRQVMQRIAALLPDSLQGEFGIPS